MQTGTVKVSDKFLLTSTEALQHTWLEEKLEWWYEVAHATDEGVYWYDE